MSNPEKDLYERIHIKPPIDLIADEYEHFKDAGPNIAVHVLTSISHVGDDSVNLFAQTLNGIGYQISDANLHCLDTCNFKDFLINIHDNSKDFGGLILLFSCVCKENGKISVYNGVEVTDKRIQDIVKEFTTFKCPDLKNKPKIFIFDVYHEAKRPRSLVETDGERRLRSYELKYDTPAEADMFIIYKKTEGFISAPENFVSKLCTGINQHGKVEDVATLVTCLDYEDKKSRPLVISTMTRKFYFTASDYRGHHYHIHQQHKELMKYLEDINEKVSNVCKRSSTKTGVTRKTVSSTTTRVSTNLVSQATVVSDSSKRISKQSAGINSSNKPLGKSDANLSNTKVIRTTKTTELRMAKAKTDSATKLNGAVNSTDTRSRLSSVRSDISISDKVKK